MLGLYQKASPVTDIHADIGNYYAAKVLRYGATPLGVDWTCSPTQELRFVQLLKLIGRPAKFSINDIGCGYGALVGFLRKRFSRSAIDYFGVDIAPEMIAVAIKHNAPAQNVEFAVGRAGIRVADYSVASGIFNVKLYHSAAAWAQFVASTLDDMARSSRKGFAVNFLAPLGSGEEGRQELYRVAPEVWLDYCQQQLGLKVTLLEAYGLREFTLLVRV